MSTPPYFTHSLAFAWNGLANSFGNGLSKHGRKSSRLTFGRQQISGSVPGADTFLGVHFYFWNGLCSLYYDPVTLCVKLFSSHFCSEEVKNLKLVLGVGLILCSTTHMCSFLYLSLSQVTSTTVWCFGLYVLFKRLKNLWVGLGKLNFIFNVLITWNKCINLMFLSGFLFWNHTFDLHRKTRAMNPHCPIVYQPSQSFFAHLSRLLPSCQIVRL